MKRLAILGSTGSIGCQTLDIVRRLPDRLQVVALAANHNVERLTQQSIEFGVQHVCIGGDREAFTALQERVGRQAVVHHGLDGICELATLPEVDMVVVAVAGAIGIAPTHAAIRAGKPIALASKEVLVAAGEPTMKLALQKNVPIFPIDSEHSAIFQCLQAAHHNAIERIYLTASGGPFRQTPLAEMEKAGPAEALKHPTWNMGGLVTINSATLMNKGLEIIEASWLFGVDSDCVEVVIHPQSIIHSMIRFADGSVLAQLGLPDMRLPIQYALLYPDRVDSDLPRLDAAKMISLTFEPPDLERFPAVNLARKAVKIGGTAPAVMNAANEQAVDIFLSEKIPLGAIMKLVYHTMERHEPVTPTFENIMKADAWARDQVIKLVARDRQAIEEPNNAAFRYTLS